MVELTEAHLSEIEEGQSQQRIQQQFVGVMSRIRAKNIMESDGAPTPSPANLLAQSSKQRPPSVAQLSSSTSSAADSIPTDFA